VSALSDKIDKQLERVMTLLRRGDETPYYLRGRAAFVAGQNTPVEVAFPVPADADFRGTRLFVSIEARRGSNESFTPCDWTYANDAYIAAGSVQAADIGAVSGAFELLLPEPYANQATLASALFSGRHGYATYVVKAPFSAWAGALEFWTPVFIPRSSTCTLRFTPTYSNPFLVEEDEVPAEYGLRVLFEGYKDVRQIRRAVP